MLQINPNQVFPKNELMSLLNIKTDKTFYKYVASGKLKTIKIANKTHATGNAVLSFFRALEDEQQ